MGAWSVLAVLVILAAGQTGLALLPVLALRAPLALLALRPQPEMMLLLAGKLSPVDIVLVAVPLRLLIHISYFELGRWGGEMLVARTRAGAWALNALSRRWLGMVLVISCLVHQSTPVDMALGARGTRRRPVVIALLAGVTISSILLVWLGTHLTPYSAAVLAVIGDHPLATLVLVGVLAATALMLSARQVLRAARAVREDARQTPGGQPEGEDV
ncbi:hypothetical protein [Kutzneria sp. 744]|uniref:hypothetical protein n=1 Tax=Kutzneria sp. (strain 744) TaxID=345341 RepID=UPI0003EEADBB|nr:hypothetical protein [Kutzneria sp. 744]EWM12069.1 hypothetical protein KUTG_02373 [Kutzneria sp. 744]